MTTFLARLANLALRWASFGLLGEDPVLLEIREEFMGVRKEFKEVREEFKEVREEFKEVREEFKGVRKEFKEVREEFKEVREEFKEVREEVKSVREEVEGLSDKVRALTQNVNNVNNGMNTLQTKVNFVLDYPSPTMTNEAMKLFRPNDSSSECSSSSRREERDHTFRSRSQAAYRCIRAEDDRVMCQATGLWLPKAFVITGHFVPHARSALGQKFLGLDTNDSRNSINWMRPVEDAYSSSKICVVKEAGRHVLRVLDQSKDFLDTCLSKFGKSLSGNEEALNAVKDEIEAELDNWQHPSTADPNAAASSAAGQHESRGPLEFKHLDGRALFGIDEANEPFGRAVSCSAMSADVKSQPKIKEIPSEADFWASSPTVKASPEVQLKVSLWMKACPFPISQLPSASL